MKIELFYTPGCARCATATTALKAAAEAAMPGVEWSEVNVLDDLDRAVDRGVLTLPALAVDGELVFSALPTAEQFVTALRRRESRHGDGA